MRVVAGEARGRRLVAPPGKGTRPTTDRVRESMFNALTSLDAVHDAVVVDLFAGSGALGIEALSRGARSCVFVEQDRAARTIVQENLTTTGLADRAKVLSESAERFVARAAAAGTRFDLALLDPPYAYAGWADLLASFPADLVVIETDREPDLPAAWEVARRKWYGSTLLVIARPAAVEPAEPAGDDGGPTPRPGLHSGPIAG